jgi:hypothetical protein
MAAVVLGWDPDRGTRWVPPFAQVLAQLEATGSVVLPWLVDAEPVPSPGTVVHLMLQGRSRGLVGRGVVRSAPYPAFRADQPGRMGQHVLVAWDHLLPVEERIRPEELAVRVPGVAWGELYAPAVVLPFRAAHELERVWAAPHPSAGPSRRRVTMARSAVERVAHDVGQGVRAAEQAAGRAASRVGHEVAEDAGAAAGLVHSLLDHVTRRGA